MLKCEECKENGADFKGFSDVLNLLSTVFSSLGIPEQLKNRIEKFEGSIKNSGLKLCQQCANHALLIDLLEGADDKTVKAKLGHALYVEGAAKMYNFLRISIAEDLLKNPPPGDSPHLQNMRVMWFLINPFQEQNLNERELEYISKMRKGDNPMGMRDLAYVLRRSSRTIYNAIHKKQAAVSPYTSYP